MKISRNDPCPCGSGRKYKHCCLNKQIPAPSSTELTWRRIRRELEGLSERMLRFAVQAYGREMAAEAWGEFMLWSEDEPDFDAATPHTPIFLPWMLHHWSPEPDSTEVADAALHGVTPTRTYLQRKGHQLPPLIREYLQSCLDRPFSFYEVEHVVPGQGMTLRDLMTDARHEVHERGAAQSLAGHEVIYAQLAAAGGLVLLEATCPMALAPGDKVPIIALREHLREEESGEADPPSAVERQQTWDIELRQLYLSLSQRYLYPSRPMLMTSDDEVLEFHTLVYDIDSAQAAFDALRDLNPWADGAQTEEAGIRRHADGLIERAEIEWVRSDPDSETESGTVLGTITIDGARLTAEVKSRERADLLKDIIEDRLGAAASFRADEIQTPEQAMAEGSALPSPPRPQDAPETQAILADYLRSHYKRWPDMPLPALGNRTPREVVRTAAGANRWRPCCSTRSDTTRDCPPPSTSRSSIPRVGNWAWRSELLVSAIARNIAQSLGICDSLSLRCGMDGAFRGIWNATEPRSRSAAADTDHDRRVARCVKRAQASRRHGTPAPAALPHRRQLLSRLPRRAPASAPRQPDATAPPARRPLMTNAPSRSSGAITSSGDPDERRAPVRLRMGMDPYTPLLKVSPADESQSASL